MVSVSTMKKAMDEVVGAMNQLRTDVTEAVVASNPSAPAANPALAPPPPTPTPVESNPIGALREAGGLSTPSRGGVVPAPISMQTQTPTSAVARDGMIVETYSANDDVLSGEPMIVDSSDD